MNPVLMTCAAAVWIVFFGWLQDVLELRFRDTSPWLWWRLESATVFMAWLGVIVLVFSVLGIVTGAFS